ncbi:MAG: multiheme c-type cytochrome [bacterium]
MNGEFGDYAALKIIMKNSLFNILCSLFAIALAIVLLFHWPAFSQGKYQTVGPDGCGSTKNNCHASENKNVVDKHKNSLDFAQAEEAAAYAEKSGVGTANMLKGNSKCMECHGTVVSGRETKEAEEGVSCESCHGAGSGFKDVHSEGPKGGPGIVRDGYTKSIPLGLRDLNKAEVLAAACVRCHLLTDQKILAAGHPDGSKFNYKSGMKSVAKHWKYRDKSDIPDQAIFKSAVSKKGPTGSAGKSTASASEPPAAKVRTAAPATTTDAAVAKQTTAAATDEPAPVRVRKVPPPPRPAVADMRVAPTSAAVPVELPPFPVITDSTRVDQMLLIVKRRLELLYKKTGN